eukprot:428221_1
MRVLSLSSLCSSQYYILNMNLHNQSLKKILGLNKIPSAQIIAKQLVEIGIQYDKLAENSQEKLSFQEWLAANIPVLYRTITHQLFDDVTQQMSPKAINKSNNNNNSNESFFASALNFIKNTSDTIAAATNDNYNENILRLKKQQLINREKVKKK